MTNTTRNRGNSRGRALFQRWLQAGGLSLLCAAPAMALDLELPGNARETARVSRTPESARIAIGPFTDGTMPMENVEGAVSRAAWRVDVQGITSLQLLGPLRDQLEREGFEILYECQATVCGGFDFRYRLDIFSEPAMHVDLFDFRYLSARRGQETVALLVSRSSTAGFIQLWAIAPEGTEAPKTAASGTPLNGQSAAALPAGSDAPLPQQLETRGHAVLSDLTFQTGSSALGEGPFASLAALAEYLRADPARRVALVGHTDAVGALDGNIALSRRRAASVLERLVSAHGIPRAQLDAEGVGYLAPIANNLTAEGREQNRRVEAVLLNTQ